MFLIYFHHYYTRKGASYVVQLCVDNEAKKTPPIWWRKNLKIRSPTTIRTPSNHKQIICQCAFCNKANITYSQLNLHFSTMI